MNEQAVAALAVPPASEGATPSRPAATASSVDVDSFTALFDAIQLEPPAAGVARPSILKEVALAQQDVIAAATAPLPDLTQLSDQQAMALMANKYTQVTMAKIGLEMATNTAGSARKSVESVLNQK